MHSGSEGSGRGPKGPCPSVVVVMLHWGPEEVTKRCLQSLGRIAYPAASVILIDNADTLSSSVAGWAHPLPLDLVRPGRNLGFAEGCAVGMSIALERGADYVLLLNNDVVVDPPFLARLVAAVGARPAGVGFRDRLCDARRPLGDPDSRDVRPAILRVW